MTATVMVFGQVSMSANIEDGGGFEQEDKWSE